jgi:uracil-DNA glycosylase family 4
MFTGDRSGDFLYRALWKAGFSNKPTATHRDDVLMLTNCAITATLHCAPSANKPVSEEIRNCTQWFEETVALVPAKVFLALGQIGWRTVVDHARRKGWYAERTLHFAHGALVELRETCRLIGSYHPSQRNVNTGRLTEAMFNDVLRCIGKILARD